MLLQGGVKMKSIILFCRKYVLSEGMLANLKERCRIAGTVECFSCEHAGFKVVGKIWA